MAADRRTGILDAAISMIARRGVRGLRVEEVAAEAGVAVSLIYYHFGNRIGLVRATLEHANERAAIAFAVPDAEGRSGRELVETTLLSEFDDDDHVRETSAVWGEVVGSAAFEPELREHLREASDAWLDLITSAIERGIEDGSIDAELDARASATRLTAMVDGLSARWLAGLLEREDARTLLAHTIAADLRSQSSAASDLP